jgi:dolichol kinase
MRIASSARPEIPFSQELLRKATHLGALIIPGLYYIHGLSKLEALSVLVPITLLIFILDIGRMQGWKVWEIFGAKLIGKMIRVHEAGGDFTGATYILTSACCTIALYPKPIAIAALAFIIVGDSFAAIIGRLWGKHRFGRKSYEGSAGCLFGTLIVAFCVPQLPLAVSIPGAVIATVVEALSTKIDDNVSVPLLSGLGMVLIQKMIEFG